LRWGSWQVALVVQEYRAVREAASQAAFAAARAPSSQTAQVTGGRTGLEALQGTQVESAVVTVDVGDFRRGGVVVASRPRVRQPLRVPDRVPAPRRAHFRCTTRPAL